MRLKPAWEVCREVGFRAQSLLFENGKVGRVFLPGRGGQPFWGGFRVLGGGFTPKGGGVIPILGGFLPRVWYQPPPPRGVFSPFRGFFSTLLGGVYFPPRVGCSEGV